MGLSPSLSDTVPVPVILQIWQLKKKNYICCWNHTGSYALILQVKSEGELYQLNEVHLFCGYSNTRLLGFHPAVHSVPSSRWEAIRKAESTNCLNTHPQSERLDSKHSLHLWELAKKVKHSSSFSCFIVSGSNQNGESNKASWARNECLDSQTSSSRNSEHIAGDVSNRMFAGHS